MKCLLAFSSFALLSTALAIGNGFFNVPSIGCLSLSLLMLVFLLWKDPQGRVPIALQLAVVWLWTLSQFFLHVTTAPGVAFSLDVSRAIHWDVLPIVCAALFVYPVLLSNRYWKIGFFAIVALFVVMGAMVLVHSRNPPIDVYLFQKYAAMQLRDGTIPYGGAIPNQYGHLAYYSPKTADLTTVFIGFPYPPLMLLSVLPSHVLFRDVRFTHLFFSAGSALLMFGLLPTRLGAGLATGFLFQSRMFYFLELSWVDMAGVFFLSLSAFLEARKKDMGSAMAAGAFLCAKQTNALVFPFMLTRIGRGQRTRWLVTGLAVATVMTLPFLAARPGGFIRDVIFAQFYQPVRYDALTFGAVVWRLFGIAVPEILPFLLFAGCALVLFKESIRTVPSRNALACGLAVLVFYACNKQAFCNYYIFTTGLLMLAVLHCAREAQDGEAAGRSGDVAIMRS